MLTVIISADYWTHSATLTYRPGASGHNCMLQRPAPTGGSVSFSAECVESAVRRAMQLLAGL